MEAARSYEALVSRHITTQCHNPEDRDWNPHRSENRKVSRVEYPLHSSYYARKSCVYMSQL